MAPSLFSPSSICPQWGHCTKNDSHSLSLIHLNELFILVQSGLSGFSTHDSPGARRFCVSVAVLLAFSSFCEQNKWNEQIKILRNMKTIHNSSIFCFAWLDDLQRDLGITLTQWKLCLVLRQCAPTELPAFFGLCVSSGFSAQTENYTGPKWFICYPELSCRLILCAIAYFSLPCRGHTFFRHTRAHKPNTLPTPCVPSWNWAFRSFAASAVTFPLIIQTWIVINYEIFGVATGWRW